ncbi:MAG: hypothetical protein NWQ21_06020, partial [Desulfobacterales bacterium]|nr:hypothetical protein [Desulfobacterales bacterium]
KDDRPYRQEAQGAWNRQSQRENIGRHGRTPRNGDGLTACKPIENPDKPLRQYVAFGQPLSKEQLEALAKKQAAPVPKME